MKVLAPFNLSALHYYPVKSGGLLPTEYYLALPVLLLLVWGVLKSDRFKHELIFGLLFYFVTIVLVLQILPVGGAIVSERYAYIPYIGIFLIFGQFYIYIKDEVFSFSKKIKPIVSFSLLFLTVLYAYQTYERNKVWKDGIVLFIDVIKKNPNQGYGWQVLGCGYNEKKDYKAAIHDFDIAAKLGYNQWNLFYNRGVAKHYLEDYEGALVDYNRAIELDPGVAKIYGDRGSVKANLKNFTGAITDYNKVIELRPNIPFAYYCR